MSHAILFGLLAMASHLLVLLTYRRFVAARVSPELGAFLSRLVPATAIGLTLVAGILTGLIPRWGWAPVVAGTLVGTAVTMLGAGLFAKERPEAGHS